MDTALRQRRTLSATTQPAAGFPTVPRKPGLDGLRALAVVAVIVYHLNPAWLPGGFFGVDMFFVVSGYLITSLLVSEFGRTGGIDLRRFWLARARRLLPSVVVLMAVIVVVACLFARDALPELRTDALFSMLYVVNWWLIVHKVSYFASIGRPPLLLHLWSLSVEEQFYLLWPPALLFLLRRIRLRVILVIALAGALASSVLMALVFHPGLDPSLAYFGTDTHAQGLLIGCGLALVVPPWAPRSTVSPSARRLLDTTAIAAVGGLVVLLMALGEYSPFTYPSGFVLVDLVSAVLIVLVIHPAAALGRVLALAPLRWVGTRSYALYLWHWPIIQLTRPHQDVPLAGLPLLVLRIALMALAAELSHRFVEIPFKRPERWQAWRDRLRVGLVGPLWTGLSTAALAGVAALLVVVPGSITPIASLAAGSTAAARATIRHLPDPPPSTSTRTRGFGLRPGPPPTTQPAPTSSPPVSSAPGGTPTDPTATTPTATAPTTAPGSTTTPSSSTTVATTPPPPPSTGSVTAATVAAKEPILAIGDSVMLAASNSLTAAFGPNITIDAAVSRQVDEGIQRLQQYRSAGQLARYKTVVIDLGTNGPMSTDQFNQLVQLVQGVQTVVFYNTYDPRPWEATTNTTLAQQVPQHPGMIELDWAAVAPGPGVLYPDGIHPTETVGGDAYTTLLVNALSKG